MKSPNDRLFDVDKVLLICAHQWKEDCFAAIIYYLEICELIIQNNFDKLTVVTTYLAFKK